jgi:hypothetical protein
MLTSLGSGQCDGRPCSRVFLPKKKKKKKKKRRVLSSRYYYCITLIPPIEILLDRARVLMPHGRCSSHARFMVLFRVFFILFFFYIYDHALSEDAGSAAEALELSVDVSRPFPAGALPTCVTQSRRMNARAICTTNGQLDDIWQE